MNFSLHFIGINFNFDSCNLYLIICIFSHSSCPFDYVTVYDGRDNMSSVIGTYCGQHRNLIIYSSTENLFVTFDAIQRTANTQNRGFKGIFEFSESFVKLGTYGVISLIRSIKVLYLLNFTKL